MGNNSLRQRLISGTAWTVLGYVGSQGIRLAGNLILTRLLFPEAFGLMAIVNVFIQGLHMFSDVGLNVGVVQSRRGDDIEFLNTAWTIQVMRGFLLFSCAFFAASPIQVFYGQLELEALIQVAGLTALIEGFNSMKLSTLQRHLQAFRMTSYELVSQGIGLVATIALTNVIPSVWALVYGNIVTSLLRMVLSHIVLWDRWDRFAWNISAWKELISFGRWIFFGTALTFVVMHGDRLVLGKALSIGDLAIYSIAFFLSQAPVHGMLAISQRVLLPVYAELQRGDAALMQDKVLRIRKTLFLIVLPCITGLIFVAEPLIQLFYDPRYHGAGWMLEILTYGTLAASVNATISPMLLAAGHSFHHLVYMIVRAFLLFSAMGLGWYLGDSRGLIIGVAVTPYLCYPCIVLLVRSYGIWCPKLDGGAVLGCLGILAVATRFLP